MSSVSEELRVILDEMAKYSIYVGLFPEEAKRQGKRSIFTNYPEPLAIPYKWDYEIARKFLYKIAEYISPKESERRVIHLVNPGLREMKPYDTLAIAPTLTGGIQLIKAGEYAPAHRHTPTNLRLILEAPNDGAYIIYDGYKMNLEVGDVLVQSNWTLHEHHNDGKSDLIWFSGLDSPFLLYLGAIFYSKSEEKFQTNEEGDVILDTLGNNLKPLTISTQSYNPLIKYPFSRTKRALTELNEHNKIDEYEGIVVEYTNPINGGPALPTIDIKMRLIRSKTELKPIRSTENTIFIPVEGYVTFDIIESNMGSLRINLKTRDPLVIPSWTKYRIINDDDKAAILFSYSDRPIFDAFGLYRKEKFKE
ncbi:MAG: cupin domain-containing protein [Saccharolobus sp.]|uniref:cupin domain-containing protein n=1 Tax=Saccharolobus TaxID=2100760 RepID=UPI001F0DE5AB|nr:cupin domain-containing protein [Saccharolobus shibatae]MCH4815791.1 cupin domain-containing protein [Saccharolobus shibatae]